MIETEQLRNSLITSSKEYREGDVYVFEQPFVWRGSGALTITALGIYEAEVDGVKLGNQLFAPGYTYYPKDLYYQRYDLSHLSEGEHILRVTLAQGWYCGRFTFENKTKIYGETAAVTWVLTSGDACYTSADATVREVESPYTYAGFYDGEIYHAGNGELKCIGKPIKATVTLPEHLEETSCAVRLREEMPVHTVSVQSGVTILDFGQNFAGVICINPQKMQGDCLKLRHGEILNPDGSLYTTNLRKAKAEIVYHKGESEEIYRPRFTYMGFRYVELSGVPYEEGLLTAYAVYSDMERTGAFSCGNPLVQKLYENQVWGQKSNYVEVPTDCPQRDERMGYTGDGHVFALTGAYNYDTRQFWEKFLKDIRYSQMDNSEGYVGPTIPAQGPAGVGFMSMLGWGSCVCIVPRMLYQQFGEESFVREQYESMKLHVDCEIRKMGGLLGKKHLWISPSLGDWLAMGRDVKFMAMHNGPVSNAFIIHDLEIMIWAAGLLGKEEDKKHYAAQLEKSRAAYLKAFVKKDGRMKDNYQGAYVMALTMVIPKGELWDKVFVWLLEDIRKNGMQTGFFATEHMLPLLASNGQEKLAYDLLLNETCPGWMYQVKCGATTTWERWDAIRPDGTVNESKMSDDNMVSFNHYAFGSVGRFYYQYILGIQPLECGYQKIFIRPVVDKRLGHAEGCYSSVAGEICVKWTVTGGKVKLSIVTPAETEIVLPDGTKQTVCAGSYSFVSEYR